MNRFVIGQLWHTKLDAIPQHLRVVAIKKESCITDFQVVGSGVGHNDVVRALISADWIMVEAAPSNFKSEYDLTEPHRPQGGAASQAKVDYDPFEPGRD